MDYCYRVVSDLWNDPVFKPGDRVVCRYDDGYPSLKAGETYEVVSYSPREVTHIFTWPAYVFVQAAGRRWCCHAARFRLAETEAAAEAVAT